MAPQAHCNRRSAAPRSPGGRRGISGPKSPHARPGGLRARRTEVRWACQAGRMASAWRLCPGWRGAKPGPFRQRGFAGCAYGSTRVADRIPLACGSRRGPQPTSALAEDPIGLVLKIQAKRCSAKLPLTHNPVPNPPAPQGAMPRTHQVYQDHPLTPLAEPN